MPVRKLNNASPIKHLSMVPGVGGRQHWTESILEAEYLRLLQVDPAVDGVEEQPFTIQYHFEGQVHRYTPDFAYSGVNCKRRFVKEVKSDKTVSEPGFAEWEWAVRRVMEAQGYDFAVVSGREIREEPRMHNVGLLLRYHRHATRAIDILRIRSLLQRGPKPMLVLVDEAQFMGTRMPCVFQQLAIKKLFADIRLPLADMIVSIGEVE